MADIPRIRVVGAAVIRGDRVLIAKRRPDQHPPDAWELPGGKVEPGESDREALARELREELGIEVHVGDWLAEATHPYERVVVHLVAYACTLESGEPQAREHAELRWIGADELDGLHWAPADVHLLEAVRRRIAQE